MLSYLYGVNKVWLFDFCWYFWDIKHFIPEKIHSEIGAGFLAAEYLKTFGRGASVI